MSEKVRRYFKEVFAVVLILVFCFSMRIYYLESTPRPELEFDQYNYDFMTKQYLEKGFLEYPVDLPDYEKGKPNAFTMPGYPLFLALLYKIFGYATGSPLHQVRVFQAFLDTLTAGMLYLLARKTANARVGLMSAFFSSVYLVFIWAPTLILTEVLYTFLFVTYLYLQILAVNRKAVLLHLIAGVVFASAVLVRPAVAPLIVLPYAYYYFTTRDRKLIKAFLYNLSGFVLLMSPWWIRNAVVLKKFIPFATQKDPLLSGTYPDNYILDKPLTDQTGAAIRRIIDGFTKQTLVYLKWYTIEKFDYLYFRPYYYVDEKVKILRCLLPLHYLYVWFGWVGVFLAYLKKEIRLIALYVVFITLIQLVFVGTARYAYPVMPLLILLTAYIIDILFFERKAGHSSL